jgi:hypothetical protein
VALANLFEQALEFLVLDLDRLARDLDADIAGGFEARSDLDLGDIRERQVLLEGLDFKLRLGDRFDCDLADRGLEGVADEPARDIGRDIPPVQLRITSAGTLPLRKPGCTALRR